MNNILISHYAITIDATGKITYWICYFIQETDIYTLNKYHVTDFTRIQITMKLWDK